MHILSSRNRSEFLAAPQLIRFDYVQGQSDFEAALLIKGSTLLLKYIAMKVRIQIAFGLVEDRLVYAIKVYDDGDQGGILWSVLEDDNEKAAILALMRDPRCQVFLFNEIAVNVAWKEISIEASFNLGNMVSRVIVGHVDHSEIKQAISPFLDGVHSGHTGHNLVIIDTDNSEMWHPVQNHFITSHATSSLIDLFNSDEGNQQEKIGLWLTDNICPGGVHHSLQIPKGKGSRELTDILLSHSFGSILIESKSLAILSRERLPDRAKLKRDVAAHIAKATKQLQGGIRRLKDGVSVASQKGTELEVERSKPMHGIVVIPDLDLVEDGAVYGLNFIGEFMKATGGFLHLLDVAELLRVVQAAEKISSGSTTITPMMAFDYYLMQRAEKSAEAGTLCIEVLLRYADE